VGNRALRRAVFLDRDGVVNEPIVRDGKPYPPALDELHLVPHAAPSLEALHAAGYALLVVTNQPDIARGSRTAAEIGAIHARLADELPIDGFYVCPHDDDDRCTCRKPLPGLIERAVRERGIDSAASFIVGDRWKDIAAGRAAGLTTIFIDRGYAERRPDPPADVTLTSLEGAAAWILNRQPA
jgi:D-glycero-D-manno-heptose 1,7-bisphosphate phosphatase